MEINGELFFLSLQIIIIFVKKKETVMKFIVDKKNDLGTVLYHVRVPSGEIVRTYRFSSLVKRKSSLSMLCDGFVSMSFIAGPNDSLHLGTLRDDSQSIHSDWGRVGQSMMDGVLVFENM